MRDDTVPPEPRDDIVLLVDISGESKEHPRCHTCGHRAPHNVQRGMCSVCFTCDAADYEPE